MGCPRSHQNQSGFSLIEGLITTVLVAVLSVSGMPSLRQMIDRRAVLIRAESLRDAARLARAMAQARQTQVTLCARAPQADAGEFQCVESGRDWSHGWLVFVDRGHRGVVEPGDRVLQVDEPVNPIGQVHATVRYITFQSDGISLNAASRFTVLPQGAPPGAASAPNDLLVCINRPGRTRIVDADACG